jgi:hypothetical protein
LQIVADLDLFLVLMGGLVDHVVVAGLEEKMADLAAGHANKPRNENGNTGSLNSIA